MAMLAQGSVRDRKPMPTTIPSERRPTGTEEEGTWGQGQAWEVGGQETR